MPSFTNQVGLDDITQRASHAAGVAIIRAIQEAFYGLQAFEFSVVPQPDLTITRFRSAAAMFEQTANLYRRLSEMIPDRQLRVEGEVLEIFQIAFTFHRAVGGAILQESLGDQERRSATTSPMSSRFLVEFARSISAEVGRRLNEVPLDFEDGQIAHRVASDITVIQMLGLAATKALNSPGYV